MRHQLFLSVFPFLLSAALEAQIDNSGTQYMSETLQLDPKVIEGLVQTGDAAGKEIRYLTLVEKARKHDLTMKITAAKKKERELQRTQLAQLADGLRRTKELFDKYYEKYQIVSNAVGTVSGTIRIGKRVKSIIEILDKLRVQFMRMNQFNDRERDVIGRTILAMVDRTEDVVKAADFALMGSNVSNSELDDLREEHGNFMVTLRTIDRTDQLAAINQELTLIIADLHRLLTLLSNVQNNRQNATISQAELLQGLFELTPE